jgi:uncharacterized membrane protein
MSKPILKDLPELIAANVINEETAQRIRAFYQQKEEHEPNRLVIVFGILGALLVGLGIILIIAHNWDTLGKVPKIGIALLPLLVGQAVAAFVLFEKSDSTAWREGAAAFLFLAIAASISIVSQVYNIEGTLHGFLFLWMVLALPVIYTLRSSLASLLYIVGITWYACELSYFHYPTATAWWYWLLLALVLPHYYRLYIVRIQSNFFAFHSWFIALSVTTVLGMFGNMLDELTVALYINVFCIFILIGQIEKIRERRLIANGFLVGGSLGLISLLLFLSFEWFWQDVFDVRVDHVDLLHAYPYWVAFAIAIVLLVVLGVRQSFISLNVKSYAFIIVLILLLVSLQSPVLARVLDNILLFAFGVFTIRDGAQQNKLSLLNYGLLILTGLIICRFFDLDMSFVARGLLFVLVGAGFFAANIWMVKKRKQEQKAQQL